MPWKSTKLAFCGIALRRRTVYSATLFFAIACLPALSWALLTMSGNFARNQKLGFMAATIITMALALNGWRLILKHNLALFREEARIIWPGAVVLLLAATWLAYAVAESVIKRGRMDYIVPLVFGGLLLIVLVVRCVRIGQYPKRSDIVRGSSGRRRSRSSLPVATATAVAEADAAMEDDDAGPEPPPEKADA